MYGFSHHFPFGESGRHGFLSKLAERAGFDKTSTGDAAFDEEFAVAAKDGVCSYRAARAGRTRTHGARSAMGAM